MTSEALADLAVACPACQVKAGQKCTAPTDTSRREVAWTHSARHDERMGWTL